VEIHRRMLAQYGQSTISQRKVYEWVERRRYTVADSLHLYLPNLILCYLIYPKNLLAAHAGNREIPRRPRL
jgi:hypothetical protein